MLVVSYFMWSGAQDSSDFLYYYFSNITSIAYNHHTDIPSFKHTNIYSYLSTYLSIYRDIAGVLECVRDKCKRSDGSGGKNGKSNNRNPTSKTANRGVAGRKSHLNMAPHGEFMIDEG